MALEDEAYYSTAPDSAILFTDESDLNNCFSNNKVGIKQLLTWVAEQGGQGCPLGLEATGGLELELCSASYKAKHPVRLVMPSRITNYRKCLTLRNKTDRDDARLIAQFVMTTPTVDWQPASPIVQRLHELLKQRRLFVQMHTTMKNSLTSFQDLRVRRKINTNLNSFKRQIAQIDASIDNVIAADKQLAHAQKLLCSIPGVGKQTAALLCALIDIRRFQNGGQLSAFMGITPRRNQSGPYEAKGRISKMGNARLRCALFMAALSGRAYNPLLRSFADRLQQRRTNLTKKQIILACAHKLARIIFGVLKHNIPFDPYHLCPSTS